MGKLAAVFAALRYGACLTDPATWKHRQLVINAVSGLLGVLVAFVPSLNLSNEDRTVIAGAVAVVGGLLNAYLTAATTAKIGVRPRDTPADGGGAAGGADTP